MEDCSLSLEAFNVFEKQKFNIKKTYMIILIMGPWKLINEEFYIDNNKAKQMLLDMYLRLNAKSRDYIKLNWFHYFRSIYFRIWCIKEIRSQKNPIWLSNTIIQNKNTNYKNIHNFVYFLNSK